MTRKHPNARRAVALAILTSILLAANAGALLIPNTARAAVNGVTTPGKRPLPGDPNTPDEGGRSGILNSTTTSAQKPSGWVLTWIRDVAHFVFHAR
jgi:hypothetical protein